mgnify:CR=1 FL=1
MAIIQKKIEFVGSKGRKKEITLFDSGATYSCISITLARQLEIITPLPEPIELATAKRGEKIKADKRVALDFHIDGYRFSDEFIVIPNLSEKVIIGAGTLQKWRLKLDFENDEVIIDPRVTKLRLL